MQQNYSNKEIERRHQENLKQFEELKELYGQHIKDDKSFQATFIAQMERMEPMVKAFENKRIVRMAIEQDTKTVTFYVKSVVTIGTFILGVWAIIKFLAANTK